ncbi:fungal specific transcription factor [Aspergillus sp. HF37]|nr:fungal specific transcription factor [Aspergillus sp. HF37]
MARLGQKALHQIDTRLEQLARPEERQQNPGSESAPVPAYNSSGVAAGSEDHRGFNDIPTAAAIQDNPALEPFETLAAGTQEPGHDGFADIDMLFGDFLDLSLPTNFWDPVFTADEGT